HPFDINEQFDEIKGLCASNDSFGATSAEDQIIETIRITTKASVSILKKSRVSISNLVIRYNSSKSTVATADVDNVVVFSNITSSSPIPNLPLLSLKMQNNLNESIQTLLLVLEREKLNFTLEKQTFQQEKQKFQHEKEKFESLKQQVTSLITQDDIIHVNIAGETMVTTRSTLTFIPNTTLSYMFNGEWDHRLKRNNTDSSGGGLIYLNYDPLLFRHLLGQLRRWTNRNRTGKFLYAPTTSMTNNPLAEIEEQYNEMLMQLGFESFVYNEHDDTSTDTTGRTSGIYGYSQGLTAPCASSSDCSTDGAICSCNTANCYITVCCMPQDLETFEETIVKMDEDFSVADILGQSATQGCRNYVFSIGNRKLRIIDTPGGGGGDTRSVDEDTKHFDNIL
ncbi:unnamed protein product, partial [Didymodactylos carnosus]